MHTVFLYLCTGMYTDSALAMKESRFSLPTHSDVYGSNIGLTPKSAMEVPDDEVAALRLGSIHAFIAWLSYIFLAWSFKGVLLLLYNQLTYVTLSLTCTHIHTLGYSLIE